MAAGAGPLAAASVTPGDSGTPKEVGWPILALLMLFGFLGALDQNVIVTALQRMLGDAHVPIVLLDFSGGSGIQFDRAGWLITGYLLGYVAVLPLMGAVSDVYGRRWTMVGALLIFALGSVLTARADTLPHLVLARMAQALGAGALLPVALAAASDMVGPRRQGLVLGLIVAAAELGGVCGPLYGALITQASGEGWRLIFWLNVPIAALLIPAALRLPSAGAARPVDYRGGLTLGLALAALVAGSSSSGIVGSTFGGGNTNRWLLLAGAALLAGFWRIERVIPSPLLPASIATNRRFAAACAVNGLIGVALGVAVVVIPIYATTVQNVTPVQGGLLLLRFLAMLALGAAAGGWLRDRAGSRLVAVIGLALAALGYWLLRDWLVSPPTSPSWPAPLLAGFGLGMVAAPVTVAALEAAGADRGGVLASLVTAARAIGTMIGLSSPTSYGSWRFHIVGAGVRMPPINPLEGLLGVQRATAAFSLALQAKELLVLREIFAGSALCCALAILPALLFARDP